MLWLLASVLIALGAAGEVLGFGILPKGADAMNSDLVLASGSVVLLGASIGVCALTLAGREAWRWRRTPFEISHAPEDAECVEENDRYRQTRLRVTARRGCDTRNVRLRIIDRHPWGHRYFLHLMHDNVKGSPRSTAGEDCAGGNSLYFNFTLSTDGIVRFEYADDGLKALDQTPIGTPRCYLVMVEATGRRGDADKPVRPAVQKFVVDVDGSGRVSISRESS